MTKDPRVYLAHILECADRIEQGWRLNAINSAGHEAPWSATKRVGGLIEFGVVF